MYAHLVAELPDGWTVRFMSEQPVPVEFLYTEDDHHRMVAAVEAIQSKDQRAFKAALANLARPTEVLQRRNLAPFEHAIWWQSLALVSVLQYCYQDSWRDAESMNYVLAQAADWAPSWVVDPQAWGNVAANLLAGAKGKLPANLEEVSLERMVAATLVLLAWCAQVNNIDLAGSYPKS